MSSATSGTVGPSVTGFRELPLFDLAASRSASDAVDLAKRFTDACHHVGFALVTNHGVDTSLCDRVFAMMQTFFALPETDRRRIDKKRSPHFRGWEPVGAESTNNRPDQREQIDVWTAWPPQSPPTEPSYLGLLGPNQFLPNAVLEGHESTTNEWMRQCGVLADRLLEMLCIGLGLNGDHLRVAFGEQPMSLAKFIHYPPTPVGAAGVNAHRDAGFLTVLAPGQTPGLQVQNQVGAWIDVPAVPGTFVINLGELLQAMTGNYLVATAHRVITTEERLSAGYFHGPSLDMALGPLPLAPRFAEAVKTSPHHRSAGFMTQQEENADGVGDLQGQHLPATYGEQLWNYFRRSYPEQWQHFYGGDVGTQ